VAGRGAIGGDIALSGIFGRGIAVGFATIVMEPAFFSTLGTSGAAASFTVRRLIFGAEALVDN
jgi:hypothetical protein